MLKIELMNLGVYWVNAYIIRDENSTSCCILDPGGHPNKVLDYLTKNGLTLEAILLTHGHFDHVGGVKAIAEATGCKVYMNPADQVMPEKLTAGPLYFTDTYGEGDILNLSGLTIDVIHTPGHTPGSVCLLCEDAIFSGDTLFARSCGRTDLAGGDPEAMAQSLKRLASLDKDYRVFPGHNSATTLALEKEYNPYMR